MLQKSPPLLSTTPMTQQATQVTTPKHSTIPNPTVPRSPQSPAALPYPPNPYQKEWWGRCFRCARKGHVVAECTYPRLSPTNAKEDHTPGIGSHPGLKPTANLPGPVHQNRPGPRLPTLEPGFDDLLTGSEPHSQPDMPPDRPSKVVCYFNKDQQYQHTLQKFLQGLVVQPPQHLVGKLSLDQVAQTVAASAKVAAPQLQIATFSQDWFLVLLPNTIDRDTVVTAIPKHIWDDGFRFHSYSPWWDASVSIPSFKIWIDIHGAPLELCTDSHMARAVSSFGVFLGSMEPQNHGDYRIYSLFLATDDLARIPHAIDFGIGGLVHTASVTPRKWHKGPIYHRIDLPPMWFSYPPPPPPITPPTSPSSSHSGASLVDPNWFQGDDVLRFSLKALREIFKDFNPSDLPKDLVACLAGDRTAISANHAAYQHWVQQSQASTSSDPPPCRATSFPASPDPLCPASIPPPPQSVPLQASPNPHTQATVPRTVQRLDCSKSTPPDLAFQLCQTDRTPDPFLATRMNWDPKLLFPELSTPPTQKDDLLLMQTRTNPAKPQIPAHPLHRTTRGRINKKANSQSGLDKLDAHAFVDIPLQYEEGQRILQLIGAATTTIPQNLMEPTQATANPIHQSHQAKASEAQPTQAQLKGKGKKPQNPLPKRGRPRRASSSQIGPLSKTVKPSKTRLSSPNQDGSHSPPQALLPSSSGPHMADLPAADQTPRMAQNSPLSEPQLPLQTDNSLHVDEEEDDSYLDRVDYSGDEHEA